MDDPKEHIQSPLIAKWPYLVVIGVLVTALLVLIYSLHFSGNKKKASSPQVQTISKQDVQPLAKEPTGYGMASGSSPEPKKDSAPLAPITVVNVPAAPESQKTYEDINQRRHQASLSALYAPLAGRKGKDSAAAAAAAAKSQATGQEVVTDGAVLPEGQSVLPSRPGRSRMPGDLADSSEYNPAAEKDKEAFFNRAASQDKWQSSYTRTAGHRYELKTGGVIPAVMITGINSELPGQITAQVAQNVLDTADGRYLLIPQGAKIYGVYDSRIINGQSRVLVAWNRVIFPDGSSVTLEAMPGADSAGYSGFNDEVDNHYFRIFGTAFLMSLFSGGTAWAVDSVTPHNTSTNSAPTLQQQLSSSLAGQIGQASAQVLSKNMNIKPTLEIRPGYRFNVVVTKDLVFKEAYRD